MIFWRRKKKKQQDETPEATQPPADTAEVVEGAIAETAVPEPVVPGTPETDVPDIGENGARIRTSNGAIELNLSSELNVNLEAKTSNGKVKLDGIEVTVNEISKNTLNGKIGQGGKKISCKTSNGSITLRKLN